MKKLIFVVILLCNCTFINASDIKKEIINIKEDSNLIINSSDKLRILLEKCENSIKRCYNIAKEISSLHEKILKETDIIKSTALDMLNTASKFIEIIDNYNNKNKKYISIDMRKRRRSHHKLFLMGKKNDLKLMEILMKMELPYNYDRKQ